MEKKGTDVAVKTKGTALEAVSRRIKELETRGEIDFPAGYSPQNALRSAWLILQETVDRDKKPVLEVCTQPSIINSLFDMVIQGLNPAKKQCYFIAYGKKLSCMRSYHGTMGLAKMVNPDIWDIFAEVVWRGDTFEMEIDRGQKKVVKHRQTLESIDSKDPVAAYCQIINHAGEVIRTEVMTWDQVKTAWKSSAVKPVTDKGEIKGGTTHKDFLSEMIKRTVINRACRPVINSSNDRYLLAANERSEFFKAEVGAAEVEANEANRDFVDVDIDEGGGGAVPENEPPQDGVEEPGEVEEPLEDESPEPTVDDTDDWLND